MSTSVAGFRALFPEFEKATDPLVESRLAQAARRIDATVWDALTDDGIYYLAAHLLAISPFGANARMVNKEGGSTYGSEYDRMKMQVARGYGICGDPRVAPTFRVPSDDDY